MLKVKSIVLEINGKDETVTVNDAKDLYEQLKILFDNHTATPYYTYPQIGYPPVITYYVNKDNALI